ncbi:4'-phosphopantetheinyl transferase family protein, partial [Streptomyces chilikensis]|uniref:4'-phosphopantetheinyl transferase family protein n=1 Tax=Streptomyces chilikensis TaxID=1194079 RepID=UPI0019CFC64D
PAADAAPRPVRVHGPAGPWAGVRAALETGGRAVLHTLGADWPAGGPPRGPRHAGHAGHHPTAQQVLRHAAAAVLGLDPRGVELGHRIGGRPFLPGTDLEVSLSHTADVIVVGLSTGGRVGVDLEPLDRRTDVGLLSAQACTPGELRVLAQLPPRPRKDALLRLWTLKEAYSKALGQGLRLDFTTFGFGDPGVGPPADGGAFRHDDWVLATHTVLDGYVLSAAYQDAPHAPGLRGAARAAGRGLTAAMEELLRR